MTADASGVLLTRIVELHNGVVIGTHSAVLFGIVTSRWSRFCTCYTSAIRGRSTEA